jgi:hypothetical protein
MRYIRFAAAAVLAAVFGFLRWDSPWTRFTNAFRLMRQLWTGPFAHPMTIILRSSCCTKCPIFYSPLRTCGTPLRDPDLGCWCSTEFKNRLSAARCWLRDKDSKKELTQYGWPDDLMK